MKSRIAKRVVAQYRTYAEEYDQECRDYAEQGYRHHYCIHGTDRWTDYDNICAGCEEGWTWATMARVEIESQYSRVKQLMTDYTTVAESIQRSLPGNVEIRDQIAEAFIAEFNRYY